MKVAYLFFAYKNPRLMRKTIERLRSGDSSSFFIHIDSKRDITPYESLRAQDVFFTGTRVPVYWAEFSGVEATVLLIREAMAASAHYDYLVLLSGSDYPLRTAEYIRRFLDENRGQEFITMSKMPAPGKPLSRINTIRFASTQPVRRFAFRFLAKFGQAKRDYRKYFGDLEPYSGITWWALTREACAYILEFTQRNRSLARYFANVFAPEETFFHTILGNSPFRSRVRRSLMYEDWSIPGAHPAMINERHIGLFEGDEKVSLQDLHGPGELLFARKFSDENLWFVERVDEIISRKEGISSPSR